ncbi:response regulator transcription factor [Saccharothrix longispora]|uniref:response regulator transcription factor n=1 Tax=Saccharothrix longispora TaxID=33920 RepID=UPI0028FD7496|nr:response regulator transcription factor [Saccharothrix longispora]MBY8851183.1 response regulator transcription factor [Saccharothrix sp. MB29]MDU0294347.1 response regulator transcription factor [Saccharothrix longispora]
MIRVLVADDEPLITAGIRAVLESAADVEVVACVANGREAVDVTRGHRVDVALLDIAMPVMDGLTAATWMPDTPVVVLTAFGDEANVRLALERGVAGFLLKNCEPAELLRAVRAVHAGEAYLSPAVTLLVLGMVPRGGDRRREAVRRLAVLSAREGEILALVAEGLSNAEVGRRAHTSEATVKTYVSRILAKLDCANRVQAAMLLRDATTTTR